MAYELFRLLHFAALFCLFGSIVIENIAIKAEINQEDIRNLAKIDRIAGFSVIAVTAFGLILWFSIGKPAEFYSSNIIFHWKLAVFLLLIIIATFPAVFFHKNRLSTEPTLEVPRLIRVLLKAELLLMLIIPILAFLMARGIGLEAS